MVELLHNVLIDVEAEVERARRKHAPMNSAHEGYAVLLEEVEELWAEVKAQTEARSAERMRAECIQVAAMAVRFILDVLGDE